MSLIFAKYRIVGTSCCKCLSSILYNNVNWISSTSCQFSKVRLYDKHTLKRWKNKESSMIKKIGQSSNQGKQKKKWHMDSQPLLPGVGVSSSPRSGPSPGTLRRLQTLSVVLRDHVTSLLDTGHVCPQLMELGFHVPEVRLSSDLSVLMVYWLGSGRAADTAIEELLPDAAIELRAALAKLRVMGAVPRVQFHKDLSLARLDEVEQLLSRADMGADHEPTPLGEQMKSSPQLRREVSTGTTQPHEPVDFGSLGIGTPHKGVLPEGVLGDKYKYRSTSVQDKLRAAVDKMRRAEVERRSVASSTGVREVVQGANGWDDVQQPGLSENSVQAPSLTGNNCGVKEELKDLHGKEDDDMSAMGSKKKVAKKKHIAMSEANAPRQSEMRSLEMKNDAYDLDYDALQAKIVRARKRPDQKMAALRLDFDDETVAKFDVKDVRKVVGGKGKKDSGLSSREKMRLLSQAQMEALRAREGGQEVNERWQDEDDRED